VWFSDDQTVAEHRMYLPLAAVVVWCSGGIPLCAATASSSPDRVVISLASHDRPAKCDYRSDLAIWAGTSPNFPATRRAL